MKLLCRNYHRRVFKMKLALIIVSFDAAATLRLPAPVCRRDLPAPAALAALSFACGGLPARADDAIAVTVLAAGDQNSPTPQRAQKAVVDYTLWIGGFEGKLIDTSKGATRQCLEARLKQMPRSAPAASIPPMH